jgi:hypothetical protein
MRNLVGAIGHPVDNRRRILVRRANLDPLRLDWEKPRLDGLDTRPSAVAKNQQTRTVFWPIRFLRRKTLR